MAMRRSSPPLARTEAFCRTVQKAVRPGWPGSRPGLLLTRKQGVHKAQQQCWKRRVLLHSLEVAPQVSHCRPCAGHRGSKQQCKATAAVDAEQS